LNEHDDDLEAEVDEDAAVEIETYPEPMEDADDIPSGQTPAHENESDLNEDESEL
jgi:hypothetical protein